MVGGSVTVGSYGASSTSNPQVQASALPQGEQPKYPLAIPIDKQSKAAKLFRQYKMEQKRSLSREPTSAISNNSHLNVSSSQSITSFQSSGHQRQTSMSDYDGITDFSSVVSFDGGDESPSSLKAKAQGEMRSHTGQKIRILQQKRLSPVQKAKAALIRHLGSCKVCRDRKVHCPLEHHDIDSLDRHPPPTPQLTSSQQSQFSTSSSGSSQATAKSIPGLQHAPSGAASNPRVQASTSRPQVHASTAKPQVQACRYKTGKTLGAGSYSVVKECVHIDTGRYYAAKVISKRLMSGREHMVRNEIAILKKISLGHPNLLTLVDYFETQNNLYLVTDLALGGELFDRICRKGSYHEFDAANLINSILSAVAYLHDNDIVHRDLKPENMLFQTPDEDAELLIADFGLARIVDEEQFYVLTTTCGTPGYMAPEIFKKVGHGKPVDIWAIGVIAYFLLCGYTPFDRDSPIEEMQAILVADYSFDPEEYWRGVSSDAKDFIRKCLTIVQAQRMTAHEALAHPFVVQGRRGKEDQLKHGTGVDLLPTFKKNFNARRTLLVAVDTVRAINKLRAGQPKKADMRELEAEDFGIAFDSGYGTAMDSASTGTDWVKNDPTKVESNLTKNEEVLARIAATTKGLWTPPVQTQKVQYDVGVAPNVEERRTKETEELGTTPAPIRLGAPIRPGSTASVPRVPRSTTSQSQLPSPPQPVGFIENGIAELVESTVLGQKSALASDYDSGYELSSDGEELNHEVSYCDIESTTDSGSEGSPEQGEMSSFARSHNQGLDLMSRDGNDSPEWSELPTSMEGNSHLERLLWPQKGSEELWHVRSAILAGSFISNTMNYGILTGLDAEVEEKLILAPDVIKVFFGRWFLQATDEYLLDSFNSLHQARNLIFDACANIELLKKVGLCQETITFLSADQKRNDVTALRSLSNSTIEELYVHFGSCIQSFVLLPDIEPVGDFQRKSEALTLKVHHLLNELQETCRKFLTEVFGNSFRTGDLKDKPLWDLTSKTLSLAVALYSCAHLEQPYFSRLKADDENGITLLETPDRVFRVELRKLRCLDGLLRSRKVWVFFALSPPEERSGASRHERSLYLTTSIKDLGDIWGPVWGISIHLQPGAIRGYEIGDGSIVPWKHDSSIHPPLRDNERLCHWQKKEKDLPNIDLPAQSFQAIAENEDLDSMSSNMATLSLSATQLGGAPDVLSPPFSPKDQLLIGATPPRLRFERCKCQKDRIIAELQNSACLYPLSTRRGHHYIDSTSKSISGGQYVSLSASKTKKWEKMTTWKQTILEEWEKNPELRGQAILILERYIGVVVSLCTFNATRVRLVELLKTDSMKQILSDFRWTKPENKKLFFEALDCQDYKSIRRLWKNKEELQNDIGNAISACLKILSSTGYDEHHDELNILWVPSSPYSEDDDLVERVLPQRVVMKGSKHQWIRLLRDTEISCTMAVIVEDSLANRGHGGRSCRRRGPHRPTVLETAIRVNEQVDPSKRLRELTLSPPPANQQDPWHLKEQASWQKYWDPSSLRQGSTFWLGYQGQLKVAGLISETGLLMTWDKDWMERIRKLLELKSAGPGSVYHNEFSGEMWGCVMRPLPVHVMSQDKS